MTAWSDLNTSRRLNLLDRYETRFRMMFQRALRNLVILRELALPRTRRNCPARCRPSIPRQIKRTREPQRLQQIPPGRTRAQPA